MLELKMRELQRTNPRTALKKKGEFLMIFLQEAQISFEVVRTYI